MIVFISLLSGLGMLVYVIVELSALRSLILFLPYAETLKPNTSLALRVLVANFLEFVFSLFKSSIEARCLQTSWSVMFIKVNDSKGVSCRQQVSTTALF